MDRQVAMFSKFPGTCRRCGQRFPQGEHILWSKSGGSVHFTSCPPVQQPLPAAQDQTRLDLRGIVAFLHGAMDRGLKFPKARFLAPGNEEMRLSLAGRKSKAPGSVQVVVREQWVGRVEPDGKVVGLLREDGQLQRLLVAIAQDPAKAAKAYGALMCRCSFCDKALTDEGSVEAGYGPICADKYGLPHKARGTKALQEVPVVPDGDTLAATNAALLEQFQGLRGRML